MSTSESDEDHSVVGIVVAHPDDETLWSGGTMLLHPRWRCSIFALCRGNDPDRAPRFHRALGLYRALGAMADLDDGPEQSPLDDATVQDAALALAGADSFDLLITHDPRGEYTSHRRHEEVSRAVTRLWGEGKIRAKRLWLFAYEDGGRSRLPSPRQDADVMVALPPAVFAEKERIIREVYGFAADSWEARAAPRTEAFHSFISPRTLAALE